MFKAALKPTQVASLERRTVPFPRRLVRRAVRFQAWWCESASPGQVSSEAKCRTSLRRSHTTSSRGEPKLDARDDCCASLRPSLVSRPTSYWSRGREFQTDEFPMNEWRN